MPLSPFDATPGSASANSYADVAYFDAYAGVRMPALSEPGATAAKENVLIAAAMVLDACFQWTGTAVDAVQAMTWPRNSMLTRNNFPILNTVIPAELKNAQCEQALQMFASDLMASNAAAQAGVSMVKAGSVEVAFQTVDTSSYESVDIILRRLGSEFLYVSNSIPQAVRMLLVPSWYEQPTIFRKVVFGAF
jgi:hypothetical protein